MLNNRKNGLWLYSNGSTLQFRQGTFAQLEYGTPWVLQYVSSKDAYTIRWYGGSNLYLYGSASSSNSSVSLANNLNPSTNNQYLWEIEGIAGENFSIRNKASGRLLAVSSTNTVYTTNSTNHDVFWRITGWRSGYNEISSVSFQDMSFQKNQSRYPVIRSKTPMSANLTNIYDFTYSINFSHIYANEDYGYITTDSGLTSNHYQLFCEVTHKPTGQSYSFKIYINPSFYGIGVEAVNDTAHDHSSLWSQSTTILESIENGNIVTWIDRYYPSVETSTISMGYPSTHSQSISMFTINEINQYLTGDQYGVLITRSHGYYYGNPTFPNSTYICIEDIPFNISDVGLVYTSSDLMELNANALSHLQLVMFVGCNTGAGGVGANNLPSAAVEKGATTAIGFKNTIYCDEANYWTMGVMQLLSQGYTIQNACATVSARTTFAGQGLTSDDLIICGDPYYKLNPGTIS